MNRAIHLLVAAAILGLPLSVIAATLQGRAIAIADGDTVTILDGSNIQWKIRLAGIDAPEKKQAFGQKSKRYLSKLIYNKLVQVKYIKRDRYGRVLGKILVNGIDANLEQINAGMAWHYKQYAKDQHVSDRFEYAQAEERARVELKGLWADSNPTPPWEWRAANKGKR